MSRSYKHSPIVTDGHPGTTKEMKRYANKATRNTDFDELPLKGKGYKKVFCSYDIHDQIDRMTREEQAIEYYNTSRQHGAPAERYTFEEWMEEWEKDFKRK